MRPLVQTGIEEASIYLRKASVSSERTIIGESLFTISSAEGARCLGCANELPLNMALDFRTCIE
jgi:hypothetical protein